MAELRAAKELSGITPADVRARGFRLLNALALAAKARGIRGRAYVPPHDYVKSEHLTIHASDDGERSAREKWSDTNSLALEYRLHDVLATLFERDKNQIEHELLEAIERRKREEIATARATEAYYEQRRLDTLLAGFSRYTRKRELAGFVAAMEQRAASLDGAERTAADEWIAWCREYVAALDPFACIAMPETKPPGYTDLSEFKKKLGHHGYF